jgi:hypothetical protein
VLAITVLDCRLAVFACHIISSPFFLGCFEQIQCAYLLRVQYYCIFQVHQGRRVTRRDGALCPAAHCHRQKTEHFRREPYRTEITSYACGMRWWPGRPAASGVGSAALPCSHRAPAVQLSDRCGLGTREAAETRVRCETRTRRAPGQAATARSCTVVLCFCSFWCLRLRPREPRARWSRGDRAACAWRWRGRCVGFTEFQEPAAAGETTLSDATSAAVDILLVVFFYFNFFLSFTESIMVRMEEIGRNGDDQ